MTKNDQDFNSNSSLEEPLLVQTYNDIPASVRSTTSEDAEGVPTAAGDSPLASRRQVRGAAWAGGITGLVIGGPIGAGVLAYAGHQLAKKNDGDAGKFCRKTGDFFSKAGRSLQREWKEAKSERHP
jgi:hypothetical protein